MTESTRTLTPKGRHTRDRIVNAAANLMVHKGVASVSLDDVGRATATSKSQMYHYFSSKDDLVGAVVEAVGADILSFQGELLRNVQTIDDLETWANAIVDVQRGGALFEGCPLGTLANDLAGENNNSVQPIFDDAFARWRELLEVALDTLVANGVLRRETDTHHLAVATLSTLQGGLLMAKATQDEAALRIPLDAALAYVRSFRV